MVCIHCGGKGIYEVYGKKYQGIVKCLECDGAGEINSFIKCEGEGRYAKATFVCETCGYVEFEDEEGLGYCPMCK